MRTIDDVVSDWCTRDHARALLPVDHEIIESTRAARALVVERIRAHGAHPDLFHACAALGRLFAERGGSPTLAVATIEGARAALGELPHALMDGARAAIAEAFVRGRLESAQAEAAARWEFPHCAVPLDGDAIAIAAGYPDDDGEALAAWAARVANAVARAGMRRAYLAGGSAARDALVDAFALVGVHVTISSPPAPRRAR